MSRELHSNVKVVKARTTATISSDTTSAGDIIDLAGYGSCMFVMLSGTLVDGAYAPKIEVGNNSGLSDAVELTGSSLLGTTALGSFALADDNAVKKIGFKVNTYRYARLSIVSTAVTSGGPIGAIAILGDPAVAPVA
jgi:hypothetical protein